MKINQIQYKKYGKFLDKNITFNPNMTIILGDNEAGKSTLFQSIIDLMFGFEPANREKNLYTNWHFNEINFNAEIFENGELFEVERRLISAPKVSIVSKTSSTVFYGRNDALPWIAKLSSALYKSIFHIKSEDLNSLDEESWSDIQERLIYNYGLSYLNKTSTVLNEMDKSINSLWRNDRKGSPKINRLNQDKNELEKALKSLELEYREIHTLETHIAKEKERLEEIELDFNDKNIKLKTLRYLLPIKEKMTHLENLEKKKLDLDFPGHLIQAFEAQNKEVSRLNDAVQEGQEKHHQISMKKYTPDAYENLLLEHANQILLLDESVEKLKDLEQELHILSEKFLNHMEKMDQQFEIVLNEKASDALINQLLKINPFEVKSMVQKVIEVEKSNQVLLLSHKNKSKHGFISSLIMVLIGISSVLAFGSIGWVPLFGMGLTGFGLSGIFKNLNRSKNVLVETESLKKEIEARLGIVKISDYVWSDHSFMFFLKLEQLLALSIEKNQLEEKREALTASFNKHKNDLGDQLSLFKVEIHRNEQLSAQMIRMDYDRLQEKLKNNASVVHELAYIEGDVENLTNQLQESERLCERLKNQIAFFGQGNFEVGYESVLEHYETIGRIKHYKEELDEQPYPVEKIKSFEHEGILSQHGVLLIESELERLSKDREELKLWLNRNEDELVRLKESYKLELVEDALEQVRVEIESTERERDILMISRALLTYSDSQYRLKNQPEIIRLVGAYMNKITNGKYSSIVLDETQEKLSLYFKMDHEIVPLSKAFSKGTINQLFLAFRLAIIKLMDPDGLYPLVLDEALVHWDSNRLTNTVQLICQISQTRQVIATTCHPAISDALKCCQSSKTIIL